VGVVAAYAVSPRVRAWFESEAEGRLAYKGLELATDVALTPAHAWARVEGREALIGIDDLAQSALGPVEEIELPTLGTRVRRGQLLFRLRHGRRVLSTRAPLSGEVVALNPVLGFDPGRVNAAPFGAGWLVRLRGKELRRESRALLRGARAQQWFRHEVDRLVGSLGAAEAVPTLPDGGLVVGELHRHVDDDDWERLRASFFEQTVTPGPR
jgi:glycine cleavage system H protein